MPTNLSVKNVPDELAERLRARAARNHRSLQRELLSILEAVAFERAPPDRPRGVVTGTLTIEEVAARARILFPDGTPSSVDDIRAMRDER